MNYKRFFIITIIAVVLCLGGMIYYFEVVNPVEEHHCEPPVEEPKTEKKRIKLDIKVLLPAQDVPMTEYDGDLDEVAAKLKKIDNHFSPKDYHITVIDNGHADVNHDGKPEATSTIELVRVLDDRIYTDKCYRVRLEDGVARRIEYDEAMENFDDSAKTDRKLRAAVEKFEQTDRYRQIDESLIKGAITEKHRDCYQYSYFTGGLYYLDSVTYTAENGYPKTVKVQEFLSLTDSAN